MKNFKNLIILTFNVSALNLHMNRFLVISAINQFKFHLFAAVTFCSANFNLKSLSSLGHRLTVVASDPNLNEIICRVLDYEIIRCWTKVTTIDRCASWMKLQESSPSVGRVAKEQNHTEVNSSESAEASLHVEIRVCRANQSISIGSPYVTVHYTTVAEWRRVCRCVKGLLLIKGIFVLTQSEPIDWIDSTRWWNTARWFISTQECGNVDASPLNKSNDNPFAG
jgi:hypothetical protein